MESPGHSLEVGRVALDGVLVGRAGDELDPAGGDPDGNGLHTVEALADSEVAGQLHGVPGVGDEVRDLEDVEVGRVGGGVAAFGVVFPDFHGHILARNPSPSPPNPPTYARARVVMSIMGPSGHCTLRPPPKGGGAMLQ